MIEIRRFGIILGIAVLAAACGAGTSPTPSGGAGSATPATAGQGTSQAPVGEGPATQAATATPPTATSPAGGGVSAVCDLVTAAELETILGLSPVVTEVIAGPPDTCDVQVDSAPTAAFVLTNTNGKMIYDVLAAGADAQMLDGIGDGAFYSAETQLVVFKKGDAMVSVAVTDVNMTDDQRIAAQKAIAVKAASRL